MRELLNRYIPCINRSISLNKLHKLFSGLLPVDSWIIKLHILPRRLRLRHHWSERSDWRLRGWKILHCLCDSVLKLLDWDVSGVNWHHCMHGMSRGLLLCYYGSHSSDERLRRG